MFPEEELQQINRQEKEIQGQYAHRIFVCMGAACLAARSAEVKQRLEDEARKKGMEKTCSVSGGGCRGLCVAGPTVTVEPDDVLYGQVKATDAPDIIASLGKEPVKRLHRPTDKPFFTRQQPAANGWPAASPWKWPDA